MHNLPKILRHSSADEPGITRRRQGKAFIYALNDARVECPRTIERINSLAIPPAYKDVWICKDEFGHLQAVGIDDKGRKQYSYHVDWTEYRAKLKFDALVAFGDSLHRIRRRVTRDLRRDKIDKRFACAALVRMIDRSAIRIGSELYARTNKSYGATTLRRKHVSLREHGLMLDFSGKGGKRVRQSIRDKTLHRALEAIDDLPGRRLFQYVGPSSEICNLDSADVNAYIGDEFSAKTFRTWRGSAEALRHCLKEENLTVKSMCEAAAAVLHNTSTICRNSYVHPKIIGLAQTGFSYRNDLLCKLESKSTNRLRKSDSLCLEYLKSNTG